MIVRACGGHVIVRACGGHVEGMWRACDCEGMWRACGGHASTFGAGLGEQYEMRRQYFRYSSDTSTHHLQPA